MKAMGIHLNEMRATRWRIIWVCLFCSSYLLYRTDLFCFCLPPPPPPPPPPPQYGMRRFKYLLIILIRIDWDLIILNCWKLEIGVKQYSGWTIEGLNEQGGSLMCVRTWCSDPSSSTFLTKLSTKRRDKNRCLSFKQSLHNLSTNWIT